MKIAVNTPNGNIGRTLTKKLLDAQADVVLLTRSPEKLGAFKARGASVQVGDLSDTAFVTTATEGVDSLFWLSPSDYETDDLLGHYRKLGEIAVAAVKANGIGRVMSLSSVGAQHATGVGPIGALHDVEKMLEATDAQVLHLRPGYFMENYFLSAETIAKDGGVYLPIPAETLMWMIATRDIGETAAELLMKGDWEPHAVIELTGPKDLTFAEAASMLGEGLGKEVTHIQVTPDDTRAAMEGMGISDSTIGLFLEMYEGFANGRICPEGDPRRTATSLVDFAREVFRPALASMG
jgi:uncharacterized protein YbjT (DUF2867 family)